MACFEHAVRLNADNIDALWQQGDALVKLGHYEEAVEISATLCKRDPDNWHAWYNKAWCLEKLERYEQVIPAAKKVIALCHNNEDGYELLGNALLALERFKEALAQYDKALKYCPTYWSVWASKGFCLLRLERYAEALPCYETATRKVPDDPEWWNSQGFILHQLDRDEEALACYETSLSLNPDYTFALSNMADLYWGRKDYAKAEQLYCKVYHLDPDHRRSELFYATWCMFYTQRYKEMIPPLLSLLPYAKEDDLPVAYRLGVAYKNLHRYSLAVKYYTLELETSPDNPDCWFNIAICKEKLRHYDQAKAAWLKALELYDDPDSQALCLYGLGMLCGKQQRYAEAVDYFDRSLALDPNFDDCRQARSQALRLLPHKTH